MKWIKTFTLVMRTNLTALREKFTDPERTLNQLILDMEEELERVRDGVAQALADEIQLAAQVKKARAEAQQWMERARAAMDRNREEAARSAIDRKIRAEERAMALETEHKKEQQQCARLQGAVRELEDKIRQARHKRTLLLARLLRAESGQRINDALNKSSRSSAFSEFDRLERRVERSEALADAYDRLDGREPEAEELEREFAEAEHAERLARELDDLKKRVDERDG